MTDHPTSASNTPADPPQEGGWHKPQASGGWQTPQVPKTDEGGWRAPQRLAPVAVQEGWRTINEADDSGTVEAPAELLPHDDSPVQEAQVETSAAEAAEQTVLPYDDAPLPLDEAAAESAATAAEVLPFEADAAAVEVETTAEPSLAEQIEALDTADADLDRLADEDDDEESFSMSELVALASLVDEQPRARIQPAAAAPAAPVSEDDPAEVARRKVAELTGTGSMSEDPAEVARRMAQQLASSQPLAAAPALVSPPPPVAPVMSSADQELLGKYRRAEEAIRSVRSRFRSGEITREQMQAELRQHMVLDEQQVWWMMGVESDSWYRFEGGQWVVAMPRVIEQDNAALLSSVGAASVVTSAESVAFDLPQLDQTAMSPIDAGLVEGATVRTTPIQMGQESMPLPRQVPVRDPEATVPGMPAVYLDPNAGIPSPSSQATVASAAVDPFSVVSSPVQAAAADVPPDYEIGTASPLYEKAKVRQQQSTMRTVLLVAGIAFAGLIALMTCGIISGVLYYRSLAAPWEDEVAALVNYQPQFRTARILAADGSLIAELTSREGGARDTIPLEEISPYLIHAVISTENERFYEDPGWDAFAIGRAFLQNIISGNLESGATTLTQEIAQNLVLQDNSLSANRKLQEIVVASLIAQQYDKNFILELYLNEFFFGNQSYGVEAASQFYFGISAADLNMAQAAMIAGLLQAPATYDPVVNRQAAFDRMETVLGLMAVRGCIQFQHAPYLNQPFCVTRGGGGLSDVASGEITLQKAIIETAIYEPRAFTVRYPHFVNYIQQIIEETYGTDAMYRGGFEIRTTLVPRIQDVAQDALLRQVQQLLANGVNTGAVMVTDPRDGAILVMVGSPDFNNVQFEGQNNYAFLYQQPGSSLKPVVYASALEGFTNAAGQRQWMTPSTVIWDVPTTYNTNPQYSPVNFDRIFHGPVSVRFALQNSYNVPAVKAYAFQGADHFRDVATRLGLTFLPQAAFGLPTALGADEVRLYDMMQAYGAFANDGNRVSPYAITQITDFQGNQIALPARPAPVQAISPALAYLMQNIMSDNEARAAAFGLNSGLILPGYQSGIIAAKTGTSNDNRDLWTMGYTNNAVVGVWMGRVDNGPTTGTTQSAAVPVWNVVLRAALEGRAPEPFTNPGGVIQLQVCGDTGVAFDPAVNPNCTNLRAELFLEGQGPPPANTSFVQTLNIDTWSGLQATTACPEYVETRTFASIDDPFALQWLNSPAGQQFAQQLGLPLPLEPIPQGQCPATQQPNVRITAPTDGTQVSGTVNITGIVSAPDFNRFQLELAPVGQDTFSIISPVFTAQQPNNATLLQWNTTTVPNGIYRLRLAAVSNSGGFINKIVQIGVNNIAVLPTAIPALPTPILASPIPQDPALLPPVFVTPTVAGQSLFPAPQATLAPGVLPTPTAMGVIPLGGLMPLATPTPFGQ
jgi:membrane peptidoglycan carboxypeptidase